MANYLQVSVATPHLTVCAACDLHLYHNPCAATAAILLDRDNRVLLARRAKEPAQGMLAFPGGFVDNGESLEVALSHPNSYSYRDVIYPTVDAIFVARVDDFGAARALDAVAELVVRPADAVRVDELAFPSMRAAWRKFRAGTPAR